MEPPADENSINAGAFVIMMLYCLIISCISMVVTIYIAIRFYRNLYTKIKDDNNRTQTIH